MQLKLDWTRCDLWILCPSNDFGRRWSSLGGGEVQLSPLNHQRCERTTEGSPASVRLIFLSPPSAQTISIAMAEENPDALGGSESYDAIVLGTGLKECIISGLLSVGGYKARMPQRNKC